VHDLRADVSSAGRAVPHPARPPVIVPVRWPEEADRRRELAAAGIPRLLVVTAGAGPPTCWDADEDWVSASAPIEERAHREATIRRRLVLLNGPPPVEPVGMVVDEDGLARRGGRWVALSELEIRLVGLLLEQVGHTVSRERLLAAGWSGQDRPSRTVDGAIRRLRSKLGPLDVRIHGITGAGYLLEVGPPVP
jgi:hypothetical protein